MPTTFTHTLPAGKVYLSLYDTPQALALDAQRDSRALGADPTFYGPDDWDTVVRKTSLGDLARVAEADEFMLALEDAAPVSARQSWQLDLAGYVPDVPAFIAGHPAAMRRRRRVESDAAPLAIIADLTSSAAIGAEALARRGTAVLALVRVLAACRPISLWAGAATLDADRGSGACGVLARIDTTPLDLATAMHVLANPGWTRRLCYSLAERDYRYTGGWGFRDHGYCIAHGDEIFGPAFPATDTLVLPAIYATDDAVMRPVEWVRRYVARYGGGSGA